MQAILWPIVSWIFRQIVVKFLVVAAVFEILTLLIPRLLALLSPWLGTAALSSAFAGLSPAVWWGLDLFAFGYGVPLLISAYVSRFLIRRIPFIG